MSVQMCPICGNPATGYATIGDTRYCHGGGVAELASILKTGGIAEIEAFLARGQEPSCYEIANGQPGPASLRWLRRKHPDTSIEALEARK